MVFLLTLRPTLTYTSYRQSITFSLKPQRKLKKGYLYGHGIIYKTDADYEILSFLKSLEIYFPRVRSSLSRDVRISTNLSQLTLAIQCVKYFFTISNKWPRSMAWKSHSVRKCSSSSIFWRWRYLQIPFFAGIGSGNWSKRRQTETSKTETSTNRNVDKPKRQQTETSTNQNVDRPKRRQTKTSTDQNVDKPKRRQTKTSTNQNVDRPKRRQTCFI